MPMESSHSNTLQIYITTTIPIPDKIALLGAIITHIRPTIAPTVVPSILCLAALKVPKTEPLIVIIAAMQA